MNRATTNPIGSNLGYHTNSWIILKICDTIFIRGDKVRSRGRMPQLRG